MAKGKDGSDKKPLCFVIGPIGSTGTPERKHADLLLHSVVKEVLEAVEFGYRVKRADEDADPGMIGDRVIIDITQAHLVVADLTALNPNAFYELGIRHATEKPTIHVARAGTILPFDNVAHRTIFVDLTDWQNTIEARNRLAASVRAINEPDFKVSNPITQANASFKMRESADPRDNLLIDIQDQLAKIQKQNTFVGNTILSGKLHEVDDLDKEMILMELYDSLLGMKAGSEFLKRLSHMGFKIRSYSFSKNSNWLRINFIDGHFFEIFWPKNLNWDLD